MMQRRDWLGAAGALSLTSQLTPLLASAAVPSGPVIEVDSAMSPPEWALLQRELLRVQGDAVQAFHDRYFDARGHFECFERWGANDGPDDAIENANDWPHLYALGGPETLRTLVRRVWEGHLEQYGALRTEQVEIAREGMYWREFPAMNDWQHLSEGLSVFNVMGLGDAGAPRFAERLRRYAGFYTGEDAVARNYDPARRLIRSAITGSRGPLLRPATALDWAGDPFDASRFHMVHGETSYEQTLEHYRDYTDVVGDNPLNLQATSLVLNAFMLDGEAKYRDWILQYVGAWADRAARNGGVLPSHVDLQGRIGGTGGNTGAWWGGVYGWGFSPEVPGSGGKREDRNRVPRSIVAFMNAYLLSGDDRWLQVWRRQNEVINQQARRIDGVLQTPRMHGANGWYGYKPGPYRLGALEIWYLSMRDEDLAQADGAHPWIEFLRGRNPGYPVQAMRVALATVRERMASVRADTTTRETRLADAVLNFNPATVGALIQLIQGGIHIARPPWSSSSPHQGGAPLYARLRHFDPLKRRAGLPEDVAALVTSLDADSARLTLVNLHPVHARVVTVQAGGYAEHRFTRVRSAGRSVDLDGSVLHVTLAPGAGAELELGMRRHVQAPTLKAPWER